MATEQCFQETEIKSDGSSLAKWVDDGSPFGDFECNICLDLVKDPVVTFCGHLYCWPCIYGWITLEDPNQQQAQCPVCKSEVSDKTLIPLYGRGQTTNPSEDKVSDLGKPIPKRPPCPRFGVDVGKTTTIFDRASFFLCWCVILLLLLF